MLKKLTLCTVLSCALFATLPAAAQTWPIVGDAYNCSWQLPGNSGTAKLTYSRLDGNNYLRRGDVSNVYPNGGLREERVTVTKPEGCGRNCSIFEYTVNQPQPSIQCKAFKVISRTEKVGGVLLDISTLHFSQCSNSATQSCALIRPRP